MGWERLVLTAQPGKWKWDPSAPAEGSAVPRPVGARDPKVEQKTCLARPQTPQTLLDSHAYILQAPSVARPGAWSGPQLNPWGVGNKKEVRKGPKVGGSAAMGQPPSNTEECV